MYHCPMEGCLKKYSNKPSLRAHIVKHVKQVMSENNNTQAETSNLDMMPYLDNDLPDIGLLASIEGSNSTGTCKCMLIFYQIKITSHTYSLYRYVAAKLICKREKVYVQVYGV